MRPVPGPLASLAIEPSANQWHTLQCIGHPTTGKSSEGMMSPACCQRTNRDIGLHKKVATSLIVMDSLITGTDRGKSVHERSSLLSTRVLINTQPQGQSLLRLPTLFSFPPVCFSHPLQPSPPAPQDDFDPQRRLLGLSFDHPRDRRGPHGYPQHDHQAPPGARVAQDARHVGTLPLRCRRPPPQRDPLLRLRYAFYQRRCVWTLLVVIVLILPSTASTTPSSISTATTSAAATAVGFQAFYVFYNSLLARMAPLHLRCLPPWQPTAGL